MQALSAEANVMSMPGEGGMGQKPQAQRDAHTGGQGPLQGTPKPKGLFAIASNKP